MCIRDSHLGLGDHFDCNGMVRYILEKEKYTKVIVFCKDSYFDLVEHMYRDNPNIGVIKIDRFKEYDEVANTMNNCDPLNNDFLVVGHQFYDHSSKGKNCWEVFYDQLKVPYSVRKDFFHVERDTEGEQNLMSKLNPENKSFVFVHDDKDRGFNLDKKHILDKELHVIENDVSENIFHFIKILEEAKEIHCMESSFKTLVDLYCEQENLFFHDFRGHPLGSKSNKNWKTIKYE